MTLPMFGQECQRQLCNLAYTQGILEGLHLDWMTTCKMSDIGLIKDDQFDEKQYHYL